MIGKPVIRSLMSRLDGFARPMLSAYVSVSPEVRGTSPRAIVLQMKSALDALEDVPDDLGRRVIARLEQDMPAARTLAIFASGDDMELIALQAELPLRDPRNGRADARWGEPYLMPLLALVEANPRHGVVYVDRDQWRCFEVTGGVIEEMDGGTRPTSPGERDELEQGRQTFPAYVASRGGAAKDLAASHLDDVSRRFYQEIGARLATRVEERGIRTLVLAGTDRELARFRAVQPVTVQARVGGTVPSLPNPQCAPAEVLAHVADTIVALETEREQRLLAEIGERGIAGVDACLAALQDGRVRCIVVPWTPPGVASSLDHVVHRAMSNGYVAVAPDAARAMSNDGDVIAVLLRDVLPELAYRYNSEIELVRGEAMDRLARDSGGMAALPRW